MTQSPTRYGAVTRRAFLTGLSLAAIAGAASCAASSSSTASPGADSPTSAGATPTTSSPSTSTSTPSSGTTGDGQPLPGGAAATVSWTFSSSGGMARNPYMAVWIEDPAGAFVKTLALYHRANGDNWLDSLSSWYQASGGSDTTTSATVPAGTYTASWDGSTATGQRADQGSYFVCVETAVEHGSESLVRQQVSFGASAATTTLDPAGDISAASVDYTV